MGKTSKFSSATLQMLGVFRLILALVLSAIYLISQKLWPLDEGLSRTFIGLLLAYIAFILFSIFLLKRPHFQNVVAIRIFAIMDLLFLSVLCLFTDGLDSPLIIMILISIMAHGAFLPIWQSLIFVAIAIGVQLYFWYSDNSNYYGTLSLYTLFNDQQLIRIITQGFFTCFAVILSNIWLRKYEASDKIIEQQNDELRQASLLHEAVIQQSSNGLIVINDKGNIILINEYIRIWFGGELSLNMPLRKYLPDLHYRYLLWLDFSFLEKKPFTHNNEEFYSDFKEIKQLDMSYTLISIEQAEITNFRAQQNKLAALGQLTAAIAHEIRNPMTSIYQAAHLLKEQENVSSTELRLIQMINNNINRANKIINEVLTLAKRENPHMEFIEIHSWLDSLLKEFKLAHPQHKDCISLNLNSNFTTVYFDTNHLEQILWNLLVNAIRHSKKEADTLKIVLEGEIISQNPSLTVLDNGIGISQENQKNIFNPFFTTDREGTGLGLFLVKEICEINHSHIDYIEKIKGESQGFRIIFSRHL